MKLMGKVAAIIADSQVAFNVGARDGVEEGDIAKIVKIVEVIDPDSQENLGSIMHARVSLRIIHVQDRLSVGMVTDYIVNRAAMPILQGNQKRVKVSFDHSSDDGEWVRIRPGEPVSISSPPRPPDEPPF